MSAYLIANVEIKDSEKIKEYLASTPGVLKKYSGRFLARGGEIWIAEGSWNPERLVIVEFDSLELAKEFWNSDEYKPLRKLRNQSASTDMIIVNGISKEMSEIIYVKSFLPFPCSVFLQFCRDLFLRY